MPNIPLATMNPYVFEFEATVTHINEDGSVELDKTYFYPTGGGQPSDTGTMTRNDETFAVKDVRKVEGHIAHALDHNGLTEGDAVRCAIDRDRRIMHMRMHTATHVLCAVIERAESTKITGNQIGADYTRIDLDLETIDAERIKGYVEEANRVLRQNLPVKKYVTTREELMRQPQLIKLAMGFPESVTDVHMVEIEGVDNTPCGGTHVGNTGEIGEIVFDRTESKGKDRKRVYFTLK